MSGELRIERVVTSGVFELDGGAWDVDNNVCAPVLLHSGDDPLWQMSHPGQKYWHLDDEQRVAIAGTEIRTINTPGHSPGSVCLHLPEAGALFSGDTSVLGQARSDWAIVLGLPDYHRLYPRPPVPPAGGTRVYTGHGDSTTIGIEAPHLAEWIARGY